MAGANIFTPVDTKAPPANLGTRPDHPVPRQGIDQSSPIPTNKFYANFFLATQGQPTWTHPYSVSWSKGSGAAQSWGVSVSHIDANQRAYGPGNPVQYFINPNGIQSVILSAAELGSSTVLSMTNLTAFSANIKLQPQAGSPGGITFPLVQGMGFITAQYLGLQPAIQSGVFFQNVTRVSDFALTRPGIIKYRINLEDGKTWLLYAVPPHGQDLNLVAKTNGLIQASAPFTGTIQIAKVPAGASEAVYDASAGVYATGAEISGTVSGTTGSYSLTWQKSGLNASAATPLLMFALPHHIQTFDAATAQGTTTLQLQTTTKGVATAVAKDSWTLVQSSLPVDMGFAPWSPSLRSVSSLSAIAVNAINNVSASEVSQDMNAQTNLDSMYFSGKGLSKFATIIYAMHDLANNPALALAGLDRLKTAFSVFANNTQTYPLVYETAWKGVVSTGSYVTGDSGQDFGNTYYNDHHFHYGYFIYTAAIIGYLDPTWLAANKDYVNTLVRDAANPSALDTYFPVSRSFDWYHGHSWAKGLFESGDGKDEESSSEDALFAYAVKMWGKTIGDANMEARGNLMLSVLSKSLPNYFLMESSNQNQPANFIQNKVTGILFENKADHTTYFGMNIEYIQGIHMIPLNPSSTLTRGQTFVSEEWARYFDNGRVDQIAGGWRGILYANLAIIDPVSAWKFFSQTNFDPGWLDGGASRTWYLAYAAGLGGA
ncbi:MAG: hypothetical protein M1838_002157 [Thelocarpon superellum]|nr:MAG: hypothetical protein M1838_002157 [Thelocarpon superellum]